MDADKVQIYIMKIAFLSRYQGKIERGAEIFVKELSLRLSKKHEVEILMGKNADDLSRILKGGYDIVIPINGRFQSLKISLSRLLSKHKVLITGHSGQGWDDIANIAISKPDVFVALTDKMRKWARKWAWGSRVVKIPNGIDLNVFSPVGEKIKIDLPRPIILSVGALVWYKYHDRVIRAASNLTNGSVLIVGVGEDKDKLEKLGNQLLGKRFMIANFNYQDMPKVYRSADLFTLPSWGREAFGLVYIEAMATGLGVVAPDDPSRKEIIGNAGLFVDTTDIEKYKEMIKQALKIDWKKKARQQAEKFSWEKISLKYEEVMLDMLKKN